MTSASQVSKQLKKFQERNKMYKKSFKNCASLSLADPKARRGVTKITGIKNADSKHWGFNNNGNFFVMPNIEWYKSYNLNGIQKRGTLQLTKAKNNGFINNDFPTNKKGTILYTNKSQIFIKEMGFGNMNKCTLPCANKKDIKKKGVLIGIEFCSLAVFTSVVIKINDIYLKILQNNKRKLSKVVKYDEDKKRNMFHCGVGVCKKRDDNVKLHTIIALAAGYLNVVDIEVYSNNDNCDVKLKRIDNQEIYKLKLHNTNNNQTDEQEIDEDIDLKMSKNNKNNFNNNNNNNYCGNNMNYRDDNIICDNINNNTKMNLNPVNPPSNNNTNNLKYNSNNNKGIKIEDLNINNSNYNGGFNNLVDYNTLIYDDNINNINDNEYIPTLMDNYSSMNYKLQNNNIINFSNNNWNDMNDNNDIDTMFDTDYNNINNNNFININNNNNFVPNTVPFKIEAHDLIDQIPDNINFKVQEHLIKYIRSIVDNETRINDNNIYNNYSNPICGNKRQRTH